MTHDRKMRVVQAAIGYTLIFSMVVSPLAPRQRVAAASLPQTAQSSQRALLPTPPDITFTNSVSLLGGKPRAEAGDTLRYTLTLANHGADAQDLVLQDPLGPNFSLVPGSLEVTPLAYDQSLTTPEDTPLDITLTGADGDGDPLTYTVTHGPTHGALTGSAPNLVYTPDPNSTQADSFTFIDNDGNGDSQPAAISISVTPVNDPPVCIGLSIITAEDSVGSAVPDCTDADLDALTYAIADQPAHGSVVIIAGKLSYTPAPNYNGADSFTYHALDAVSTSNDAIVDVTVTPVNDAPVAETQSLTTAEDTSKAITLSGQDVDGDPLNYTVTVQPQHGVLTGAAPNLVYTPDADFNGTDSLTFRACDNAPAPLCSSAAVDLTITAVNDAPSFLKGADQSVLENSGPMVIDPWATSLSAGPANEAGQVLSFLVVGNTDPSLFSAGPTVSATGALAFTPAAYAHGAANITVQIKDDGGNAGGGSDTSAGQTFTITITDVNDAPVVQASSFPLDENSANGTAVGTVLYTDPDSGQTHYFAITGGNASGAFEIDPASGVITVAKSSALDFETTPSFSLTVQVTDNGAPVLSGSNTITIPLNDLDEIPTVNAATTTLDENSAIGTLVSTITFGNRDAGQNHTFAIDSGNTGGAFTIDPTSGDVRVANSAALDFETHPVFSLSISVTDSHVPANSGSAILTVNLNDVNEAPLVNSASFNLDENSPNGTNVGAVTFTDADANQSHTYSITAGNTGGAFAIHPTSGSLTVANQTAVDFETTPVFHLTVQVSDSGGLSGAASITINLNDLNEPPVVNPATFTIAENSVNGTAVGTVTFSDLDTNQTHTFAITAGNSGGTFAIEPTSGVISVASGALLDYETHPTFTLTVQVTDSGGLSDSASVTVNLSDVNEAPVVNPGAFNIDENSVDGTALSPTGPVSYTDPDTGQAHTFTITAGNESGAFAIGATSGILSVANGSLLDYETKNSYTLTVQVADNGSPALSGTAIITIQVNDVNEAPIVTNESYETIGNTLLEVSNGTAGAAPRVFVNGNLLANDVDPEHAGPLTAGPISGVSAQGGTISVSPDGAFTYLPPAGYQGTDTFDYTVTDVGGLMSHGSVQITVKSMIWYVKNNSGAGGTGQSTKPFNTLVAAQTASLSNSTIYVSTGDGTTTGQAAGITLKTGQRLIGAGVALVAPAQVNGTIPTLLVAGSAPWIDNLNAGGVGVTVTNASSVEIRGLNLAGNANAILMNTTAANPGSITIQDNTIRSAGAAGIVVQSGSSSTLTVDAENNVVSATGNGFDARSSTSGQMSIIFNHNHVTSGAAGILIDGSSGASPVITGFQGNSVDPATLGSGIVITSATFDASIGTSYQTVDCGNTIIGTSGNGVGGAGMQLTNVRGDLSFTDLDIFADGGAALKATSSAAFNKVSGTGLQLAVTPGAASLAATGGPALYADTVTLDLRLPSLTSTASPNYGVYLNNTNGTISADAGSITGATGSDFAINGGSANITYGGTITNTTGNSVSVSNHTAGTVAFNGAIVDTGAGISLSTNTGSTVTFTGGLSLTTGSSAAFTATGGGTVNVTGSTNTISTTTGAALNMAYTSIGASGLTFRSISANGATVGIVLDHTGNAGGLTVTGASTANSGGTLQNMASDCVTLISTVNVEFNFLNIDACGGTGIIAASVNGFTFRNGQVNHTGNANGEHGMSFNELTGTALIQDTAISNMFEDGISLGNTAGTLNMTVRRTTFSTNDTTYGEDGVQFHLNSNAIANILFEDTGTNLNFSNLKGDGIDGVIQDNAQLNLTISSLQFKNNSGGGGVTLSSNNTATLHLDLHGSSFQNTGGTPVNLVSMGSSTFEGKVDTNTINTTASGYGIHLSQEENSTMILEVGGNTIQKTNHSGFEAFSRLASTSGTLNLTMRNNSIQAPTSIDYGAFLGVGNTADQANNRNTFCLDMGYSGAPGGNVIAGNTVPGVDLMQSVGSIFQIEGWDTIAQPSIVNHIQAYNTTTAQIEPGSSFVKSASTCPMPGSVSLPPAVAFQADPGWMLAGYLALSSTGHPLAEQASPAVTHPSAAAAAGTVGLTLGALPAGKTVTVTFDVQIADPLPENVLEIANQASLTGSSFSGELLSDDPATPDQADATHVVLYRAPIAHGDSYTTPEDTPLEVSPAGVLGNDSAALGYQGKLTASLASNPTSGSVDFRPDGSFRFTPAKDFNGLASFTYLTSDTLRASNAATVHITVTPVNDAPVLDGSANFSLLPIAENAMDNPGTLVSAVIASAGGSPIQDADPGAQEGIAIISVNNAHGSWQYTIDGGTAWQEIGAPTASTARLLAADARTQIRFVPGLGWSGTLAEGFRFRAWDLTSGANGETLDLTSPAAQNAVSAADAAAAITVLNNTDLSITLTPSSSQVLAGSQVTYTLTVANAGPLKATGITITDELPHSSSFISASPECHALNGTVTCSLDPLDAGKSSSLTIQVTLGTDFLGTLNNIATVSAAEPDQDPDNNTAHASISVVPSILQYSLGDLPGKEWNQPVTTKSPNGTKLLGEFGNETVTLTLDNLPPHTRAILSFELYILRSWDGNQVNWPGNITGLPSLTANAIIGPDQWKLVADGKNLLQTTFANPSGADFRQAFPGNYPGGSHPAQTGASEVNTLGYRYTTIGPLDSTYRLTYTFDHQDSQLRLDFTGSGLQTLEDESWGLGHVQVILASDADPQPFQLFFPILR